MKSAHGAHHDTDTELKMQFEIDDAQIEASAKKELEIAVSGLIKDTITGYQFTAKLRERVKELANSCLDKVAFDLVQEMKPRMCEDVQAAYQAMVKAKAARMMRELEKGQA